MGVARACAQQGERNKSRRCPTLNSRPRVCGCHQCAAPTASIPTCGQSLWLDTTIVNTAVPAIADGLQVAPLSLKAVVTSYVLILPILRFGRSQHRGNGFDWRKGARA
jgi:hypothetical protein